MPGVTDLLFQGDSFLSARGVTAAFCARGGCRPDRRKRPERCTAERRRHIASTHCARLPDSPREGLCPRCSRQTSHPLPLDPCPILPQASSRWKRAASAWSCDHDGSDSTLSGSGAKAGIVLLTTASYCFMASLQEGQTARCSCSRFSLPRSTHPRWRGHRARGTRHGVIVTTPQLLGLRVTFYHIRYGPAICLGTSAFAVSPSLDSSDCGYFQGLIQLPAISSNV